MKKNSDLKLNRIIYAILAVLLFIPWLALQTRRLRDTGIPNILCYLLMVLYFISIYLHLFGLLYQIVLLHVRKYQMP